MSGSSTVEADYVVVGAGAAAMAFVDTLLSESKATVAMVDRRARPGGHWNDAYPFIRTHSAANFYGVNSRSLCSDNIDSDGLNRGHLALASSSEICSYFDDVMQDTFLPSGRVKYLPLHEYQPNGTALSLANGKTVNLIAWRRIVDATTADTRVPARHPPPFPVAQSASCIAPGELMSRNLQGSRYVIVGAGKTAIDVALWLLAQSVDPDDVIWIRPRDCWLYNRFFLQPRPDLAEQNLDGWVSEMQAASAAKSIKDLFDHLESRKCVFRIDPNVEPSMFHCAMITEAELQELRRVHNVIRLGRVNAIETNRIVFDHGTLPTSSRDVFIHCAAQGVPSRPVQPIFQKGRIVLQFVQHCWPLFSAAMIAYLECRRKDDETRNRLAQPIAMADKPEDWMRGRIMDDLNYSAWIAEPDIQPWRERSRLDGFSGMLAAAGQSPTPQVQKLFQRLNEVQPAGIARLKELLAAQAVQ